MLSWLAKFKAVARAWWPVTLLGLLAIVAALAVYLPYREARAIFVAVVAALGFIGGLLTAGVEKKLF